MQMINALVKTRADMRSLIYLSQTGKIMRSMPAFKRYLKTYLFSPVYGAS